MQSKSLFLKKSLFFFFLFGLFWGFYMKSEGSAEVLLINKVIQKRLNSGLEVLFLPTNRERVVTVYLCVKVGSKYEEDSLAGITHLIEHMIFKGGEGQKPGEVARKVEEKGGYINAFTSYEKTCYYVSGPTEVLETALEVLSQAVFNPYFDLQELEKEKEVVVEEMKMRLDNPSIVLYEELLKNSYTIYPYKRPIIGYEKTVRSFKREDLFYFINNFYTPENMSLLVVGDIEESFLNLLLDKYFGNLPKRQLQKVSFPKEPYNSSPKFFWIEKPVKEGYLAFSFPAPSIEEEHSPFIDLLAEILGGGETSRLYLTLKRKYNLVKSISASAFTPEGPGLFYVFATGDPKNFAQILELSLKEIEKLKQRGPTEEELERAKNQLLSSFIYSQETVEGLARALSSFHLLRGSYKDILWYIDQIKKATPEDLQVLAQKYLDPQKMVAVFLSEKALLEEELFKKILSPSKEISKIESLVLKNGLKVILYPREDLPTVGIVLAFPGGIRLERPEENGVFQALSLLWKRGTQKRSAEEISKILENLSAEIQGFTGRNTFGLKALTLSNKLPQVLELFKEILLEPIFSPEEIEKARPELLSLLYQQEDQPLYLALREFLKDFFPDHPYGLNIAGSKDFYLNFNSENLFKIHSNSVNPKKGVLVVVGDFDPEDLKSRITKLFEDWTPKDSEILEEKEPPPPQKSLKRVFKDSFQTQILLGFQGPGLLEEERIALEILNSALSGQDGPLFRILRDERSLAYAVTSFLILYPKKSALVFYIACSPDKEKQAISGFFEILSQIRKEGLSPKELEKAKNRLLGRYFLSLQSNLAKAEDSAINEVLGLGWDYSQKYVNLVKKVDSQKIKEIIEKYLKQEKAFLLILGRGNGTKITD